MTSPDEALESLDDLHKAYIEHYRAARELKPQRDAAIIHALKLGTNPDDIMVATEKEPDELVRLITKHEAWKHLSEEVQNQLQEDADERQGFLEAKKAWQATTRAFHTGKSPHHRLRMIVDEIHELERNLCGAWQISRTSHGDDEGLDELYSQMYTFMLDEEQLEGHAWRFYMEFVEEEADKRVLNPDEKRRGFPKPWNRKRLIKSDPIH